MTVKGVNIDIAMPQDDKSLLNRYMAWSMHAKLQSEVTFEEMEKLYQVFGSDLRMVLTMYHWTEPFKDGENFTIDSSRPFHVCDDSRLWNSVDNDASNELELLEVVCQIQRPAFLMHQWDHHPGLKGLLEEAYRENSLSDYRAAQVTEKFGYLPEALILTPHPSKGEPELREMVLYKPCDQILSITKFGDGEIITPYRREETT